MATRTRISIRIIRTPRGNRLSARSWLTEVPLRMLMNNLDPEVAERPHHDVRADDRGVLDLHRLAGDRAGDLRNLRRGRPMARERIAFQGLPSCICWLGLGERAKVGLAFNEMVASGEGGAPIVIGRDHLDSGSVASPNRETEGMLDGSDAVSDWPLLNALLNCASGATWVSIHHGGGVGMGFSQHAGMVMVCDGTEAAARRIERVLTNDPASGVMRHADAGYPAAIECARAHGLKLPMVGG